MSTRLRIAAAIVAAAAIALLLVSATASSAPDLAARASALPPAHFDRVDAGTSLDLYGARFGQTGKSDLSLVIRTHQPWQPADVLPSPARLLCLWLRSDASPAPQGRLCAAPEPKAKSGVILRYTALDEDGNRLGIRNLSTEVRRPRPTMLAASFSPALLRLAPGRYHWQVRSVVGSVEDRLPDTSEVTLDIAVSTEPAARLRCFGAASRDPLRRCVNSKLRTAIVPPPEDAIFSQNSPCTPLTFDGMLGPCEFGVPAVSAKSTIALIGDSHASHWRAALEHVAQHKHWRGVSITRSGCPLMRATTKLEPARRAECLQWNDQVPKWFARHPKIHTAFVVSHFAGDVVVPDGDNERETKVTGFISAWNALPATVKHIIVIRDTPIVGFQANECVRKAKARHRNAGSVCAVKRSEALREDPSVVAARRMKSKRVAIIDMSRYLCSKKRCFPVIGGALVYKDDQHMTDVFATTLGPYLGRAVDKVL
jgi:SGNH domain (fused to AT3 domains)